MKQCIKSGLLGCVATVVISGCASTGESPQLIYQPGADLYQHQNSTQLQLVPVGPNVPTGAEREALVRFLNEFEVLYPILREANAAKRPDQRIPFRYQEVVRDLDKVKAGIIEYMQAPSSAPRDIEEIKGEYR